MDYSALKPHPRFYYRLLILRFQRVKQGTDLFNRQCIYQATEFCPFRLYSSGESLGLEE